MKQIVYIHGGDSFSSYQAYLNNLTKQEISYDRLINIRKWSDQVVDELPDTDILRPTMPNKFNAVYDEWVIYFEKLLPYLKDDVQIVGHSLGAMFLAKYLNEKPLVEPVKRILLVAGGYDDETSEDLGSFKVTSAKNVSRSADEIHLFHSKDDPVVSFTELSKFQADLPEAISHVFDDKNHFLNPTFPELIEVLKQK